MCQLSVTLVSEADVFPSCTPPSRLSSLLKAITLCSLNVAVSTTFLIHRGITGGEITLSPCEAMSWWMCARLCIVCVYMFLCISVCSAILNPSQQQFAPSLLLILSRSTRTYLSAFLGEYEEEEGARSYFGILIIFLLMCTIIFKLRVPRALIVEIVCVCATAHKNLCL